MSQPFRNGKTDEKQDPVSDEDRALFRSTIGPVSAISSNHRAPVSATPSPRPRMREADEAAVMKELLESQPLDPDLAAGDDLVYSRNGIQTSVLRRLRRGQYRCQAEIDLHGMVVRVARQCLADFLQEALDRDYRCVRIIHGKGLRSGPRGPVLKIKVSGWLRQRDEVLAYTSARPVDGGTGALYVLLKKA